MVKKGNGQIIAIVALAIALVVMSVGFANYAQQLDIEGTVDITAAKWDVHFDTAKYTESSGSKAATSHSVTTTKATYDVTLEKPGDFYEATFTVVNEGTYDAKLTNINLGKDGITDEQLSKYVQYTVTYDGQTFNTIGDHTPSPDSILAKKSGSTPTAKDVVVRIYYVVPTSSSDLLSTSIEDAEFTVTLEYEQA